MKTQTIAILMFTLAASSAFATPQYPDKLVCEGKEFSLNTYLLAAYFAENPDKKPQSEVMSTALWRGYVATFEFKTNSLVLRDIEIQIRDQAKDEPSWKSVKDNVVPKGKDLLVDWFTGILVLRHGKLPQGKRARNGGEFYTHSNFILLEIKKGKLSGKRVYSLEQYEDFIERQFKAYKKTEDYRKQLAELKKEGLSPREYLDWNFYMHFTKYTSEFLDKKEKTEFSNK